MNISTNSFGNYTPVTTKKNINVPKIEPKKTEEMLQVTNEEKNFFTKLYPNEKEQIDNYHYYNKDGNKNGVSLGLLFDKRG